MTPPTRNRPQHRYELVKRIGVGGMAEVFSAKAHGPHGFEKKLALKRILPEYAKSARFERRLIAEARIAVTLNHANIVPVFDCGRFGDSLYVAMELVDGLDLAAVLRGLRERDQQMPIEIGLHVATELLHALDFAHTRGVVHCDVSPSNILISRAGEVKLADFGIAQAIEPGEMQTAARQIAGKWRFMSPEQTRGEDLDARSDLFSAGVVLFELFTGHRLFDGDDTKAMIRNVRSMEIPKPSTFRGELPEGLDELLASALQRSRDARPRRASVLGGVVADIARARSLHASARDLAALLAELTPDEITEIAPSDLPSSADLIDGIVRSELSLRGAGRDDWNTQETSGSGARRLSEYDDESDPGDRELPEEDRTATITLVMPGLGSEWDGPLDDDERTPTVAKVAPVDDGERTSSVAKVAPVDDGESAQDVTAAQSAVGTEAEPVALLRRGRASRGRWVVVAALVGLAGALALLWVARSGERRAAGRAPPIDAGSALAVAENPVEVTVEPLDVRSDAAAPALGREADAVAARSDGSIDAAPPGVEDTTEAGQAARAEPDAGIRRPERNAVGSRKPSAEPRYGAIKLYVEPWAEVYLDGRKVGVAPQRRLVLPVGTHRLKLVNPVLGRTGWVEVKVPSQATYRVVLPAADGE